MAAGLTLSELTVLLHRGWTQEEIDCITEFSRAMEEEVIPEIARIMARRAVLAEESRNRFLFKESDMSFSFQAAGSPSAVIKACEDKREHESPHALVAKDFIKGLLQDAPAGTVVFVEASGHHDYGKKSTYPSGYVDVRFRLAKASPEPEVVDTGEADLGNR